MSALSTHRCRHRQSAKLGADQGNKRGVGGIVQNGRVTADLLVQARNGDGEAFRQLVEPYQRDLSLHCYRILGSLHDAEDALQETLVAAWQGIGGFEGRSSIRTWLYRIATSRSLNAVRSRNRRPTVDQLVFMGDLPEATRQREVLWLEPYPDHLLDGLADSAPGPDARYELKEAVSLAFVTALQLLPPRQRAVLILRDVLGFHASEVAQILDSTEESVTSALKRARATLSRQLDGAGARELAPVLYSPAEQELVERFTRAFEAGDADSIVALLTEDVLLTMPPLPLEWQGRDLAGKFLQAMWNLLDSPPRLVATRANGQPAFGLYSHDRDASGQHAHGLLVLTLTGRSVSGIIRFEAGVLPHFGLHQTSTG